MFSCEQVHVKLLLEVSALLLPELLQSQASALHLMVCMFAQVRNAERYLRQQSTPAPSPGAAPRAEPAMAGGVAADRPATCQVRKW